MEKVTFAKLYKDYEDVICPNAQNAIISVDQKLGGEDPLWLAIKQNLTPCGDGYRVEMQPLSKLYKDYENIVKSDKSNVALDELTGYDESLLSAVQQHLVSATIDGRLRWNTGKELEYLAQAHKDDVVTENDIKDLVELAMIKTAYEHCCYEDNPSVGSAFRCQLEVGDKFTVVELAIGADDEANSMTLGLADNPSCYKTFDYREEFETMGFKEFNQALNDFVNDSLDGISKGYTNKDKGLLRG